MSFSASYEHHIPILLSVQFWQHILMQADLQYINRSIFDLFFFLLINLLILVFYDFLLLWMVIHSFNQIFIEMSALKEQYLSYLLYMRLFHKNYLFIFSIMIIKSHIKIILSVKVHFIIHIFPLNLYLLLLLSSKILVLTFLNTETMELYL